jgi:hypothetical protein
LKRIFRSLDPSPVTAAKAADSGPELNYDAMKLRLRYK